GRLGLSYSRKMPLENSFAHRLKLVFRAALHACALLEDSSRSGRIHFRTDQAMFQINDRLLAPSAPETYARVAPELEEFLRDLYQADIQLAYQPDAEKLFTICIAAPGAPDIRTLLSRLGSAPSESSRDRAPTAAGAVPPRDRAATSSPRVDPGLWGFCP